MFVGERGGERGERGREGEREGERGRGRVGLAPSNCGRDIKGKSDLDQGTLTEGEGSVQLTSSLR